MKVDELTKTELECLRLRYELGYDNKNIAAIINRSVRTVENHFRFASAKLNVVGGRGKLMVAYNKIKVL
jgi:DNA-binding CsgD family transcriptional regulator